LALSRAKVVTLDSALSEQVTQFQQDFLGQGALADRVLGGLGYMRRRLSDAQSSARIVDPKQGVGFAQDIATAQRLGWINASQQQILCETDDLLQRLHQSLSLLNAQISRWDDLGTGAQSFLLQQTQYDSISDLDAALTRLTEQSGAIIAQCLTDKDKTHE